MKDKGAMPLGIALAFTEVRREETYIGWKYQHDGLLQTTERLLQMGFRLDGLFAGSDGDLVGSRRRESIAINFGTQVRENLLIQ